MYKEIAISKGVTRFVCLASANIRNAKNYISFLDEVKRVLDFDFKMLTDEEEMNALYIAVVNCLEITKGIIVSIANASSRIVYYNRRVVIATAVIPIGVTNFTTKEGYIKQLENLGENFKNPDADLPIVGVGHIFMAFSKLSRKKRHYPVDIDHNYTAKRTDFDEVLAYLKSQNIEKNTKLKGISVSNIGTLINGMEIVDAIMDYTKLTDIVVNNRPRNVGLSLMQTFPDILERPVPDVCNQSIETIIWKSGINREKAFAHWHLSNALYKHLKVLHKLQTKQYLRPLKVASILYHLGRRINKQNYERVNYYVIQHAKLFGLSHKEIILASFIASSKNWDEFSMAEWVKYRDILTEEDLDAVRKLSIICAIAEAVNIRSENVVKDISCDVLGDSVIIKLITDVDTKNPCSDIHAARTEIYYSKKYAKEFTKIFKKNVEIL
jgi:exopolyphosphatase/guanosine-5'-triphosphate,3'-diphosphate pyrophosphatase